MSRAERLAHPALAWTARLILAAVFLFAAWPKLLDPDAFAANVHSYMLLPEALVGLVAVLLPGIELAAVLGVFHRRTRAAAELLFALMLLIFIAAVGIALLRGLAGIDCGCFGPGNGRGLGLRLLVEDLALLGLALCALFHSWRQESGAAARGAG